MGQHGKRKGKGGKGARGKGQGQCIRDKGQQAMGMGHEEIGKVMGQGVTVMKQGRATRRT